MKFGFAHPELCNALILGGCCNEYPPGLKTNMFFGGGYSPFLSYSFSQIILGVETVYSMLSNKTKSGLIHTVLPKNIEYHCQLILNYTFLT